MSKPKANYASDPNVSSEKDRCQTPSYAMLPLYPYLDALAQRLGRALRVWEPAAGQGYMVGYLREQGYEVESGDLLTGQNYFHAASVPAAYDVQTSNPPYGQRVKYRWIRTAYERKQPFALLMPFETWAAKQAQTVFEKFGVEVILPDERIDFIMPDKGYTKGGANYPSAWFTFGLNIGRTVTYAKIKQAKSEYEYLLGRREYQKVQPTLFELETGA